MTALLLALPVSGNKPFETCEPVRLKLVDRLRGLASVNPRQAMRRLGGPQTVGVQEGQIHDIQGNQMKRDMDLIRLILLEIENSEPYEILRLDLCGYEDSEVNCHLELLISAGLVAGKMNHAGGMRASPVVRLEMEGHDLLDNIRTESIWKNTKAFLNSKGVKNVSVELLKTVAQSIAKSHLGLD